MISWPAGYDRIILKETDSTNAEAIRRIDTFSKPTWILTELQTSGKGRRGRTWLMPKGNFAATLVLKPQSSLRVAALRSFVASIALRAAFVVHCASSEKFKLKWPNDVLLSGGKVAGILLESIGKGPIVDSLLIGIGANLVSAPEIDELDFSYSGSPVSIKQTLGLDISPVEFLTTLANQFKLYDDQIQSSGFHAIRTEWLSHAAKLNQTVIARFGSSEVKGIFEKIDDDGSLILKTSTGLKKIAAADVYFEGN